MPTPWVPGRRLLVGTVARFALVSLAPLLALGWFLGDLVRDAIEGRTATVYGAMSNTLFRVAGDYIVQPGDFEPGSVYPAGRAEFVNGLISELGGGQGTVRLRIVALDGRVVFANQAADSGDRVPRTAHFDSAARGKVVTDFVSGSIVGDDPHAHDLIEMYLPVRFGDDPTVRGVIIASGLDEKVVAGINSDVRRVKTTLAMGLVVLWLALMPITLSVSRRLRRTAEDNEYLALHDTLTTLPNRNLLRDRLSQAIGATARTGDNVGLLLIDLDRFKEVNDTLGHGKGDELLQRVAGRLVQSVRAGDTVARLGGDEFAVVAAGVSSAGDLADVAERITRALGDAIVVDGIEVTVRASIGGSLYPLHATGSEELLRHADIAMYAAKASGDSYAMYDPGIDSHSPSRLALTAEFRRALDDDHQLVLHYQPVASPSTGEVVAVEGLVRWNHPCRGLLPPIEFIGMAEQSGLVRRLTSKVLDLALSQVRSWRDRGIDVSVAINLSPSDLRCPALVEEVRASLAAHRLPASSLELEVTETAVLAHPEAATRLVAELRDLGVRIALDDFGTGFSSLTTLKQLHPDRLKIDRSFVDAMGREPTDAEIVRSLIGLAHSLAIGVTAEGVETAEHWDTLRDLSCDLVQGYYLARPLPADAATAWLEGSRSPVGATAAAGLGAPVQH